MALDGEPAGLRLDSQLLHSAVWNASNDPGLIAKLHSALRRPISVQLPKFQRTTKHRCAHR